MRHFFERLIPQIWQKIALLKTRSWAARTLFGPLILLATLVGWLSSLRLSLYARKLLPSWRVDAFVISIGNLSSGGSGKTPLVELLAREFALFKTAIVTRGYRGTLSKKGARIDSSQGPLFPADECGDEPYLLAGKTGIPVFVDADRVRGAQRAVKTCKARLVLLDDAFQHRRICRQCDLLLVDASSTSPAALCYPAGPLRNHWRECARADFVLLTGVLSKDHFTNAACFLKKYTTCPLAGAAFSLRELMPLSIWKGRFSKQTLNQSREKALPPLPPLPPLKVYACCGLANPERFIQTLTSAGQHVVGMHFLPDHAKLHSSAAASLVHSALLVGAQAIVCTEKDAVKWSVPVKPLQVLVAVCELQVRFNCPDWQSLLQTLHKKIAHFSNREQSSSSDKSSAQSFASIQGH